MAYNGEAGVFTNLSYEDKEALFSLLDEYFASRPHLVGGGGGDGASVATASSARTVASPPARAHNPPPATNAASRPATERAAAPARPTPSYSSTSTTTASSSGNSRNPTAFVNSGIGKVAGNSHVSGALGKIGAGGFASKMDKKYNTPAPRYGSVGRAKTLDADMKGVSTTPRPAPTSSGSSAPTTHALPPPQRTGAVLPPPSRHAGADAAQDPVPPYSGAGRVKALYDYEGGVSRARGISLQTGFYRSPPAGWSDCDDRGQDFGRL